MTKIKIKIVVVKNTIEHKIARAIVYADKEKPNKLFTFQIEVRMRRPKRPDFLPAPPPMPKGLDVLGFGWFEIETVGPVTKDSQEVKNSFTLIFYQLCSNVRAMMAMNKLAKQTGEITAKIKMAAKKFKKDHRIK